jgi:GT2 family glycosyltransferase
MNFDLILTARDRKIETLRFFESLTTQQGAVSGRILFADQGLGLGQEPFNVLSNRSKISLEVREIPPSPLSTARNEAIKLGLRSQIVGFPDDDCWYGPTVLQSIQEVFEADPEIQCVCTNVFDPIRGLSYGGRPVGIRIPINFSNIFLLPISVGIFVRRDVFEAVGANFDENLGAGTTIGSGEETELIARLLNLSAKILYVGDISVFHPVPEYETKDAQKYYSYGIGYGYLSVSLIWQGKYVVAKNLINTLIRSIVGFFVFFLVKTKRDVYWNRFAGILRGGFVAVKHLKK